MSPETWTKILYTYGPFAILVFLVFVIYTKIHSAWREAKQSNQKEQTVFLGLYGLTWIVILGVAIYSVYAWKRINLDRRPQITGTVESLSNVETLGTTFAELYLHKNPKGGGYSDYDLLLINKDQKPFPEGAKVKFTIQTPRPNSKDDDLYEYELPIQSDFYETGVVLRHRQAKLFLDHNGQEKELQGGLLPGNSQPTATLIEPSWQLFPIAYAQTAQQTFSSYDFTIGLESPDAIVRRKTRYDLSFQDQAVAVPWIDSVLKDKTSSYRLRLGVLVALNNMPNLPAESLTPATIAAIQNTLNNPDDALRNEALGLAKKYKLIPVTVYEHINYSGKSQAYGPGMYRADKSQLGSFPNDSASSVRVAKGFSVRLCEHEDNGKGGGACVVKGAGSYQLHGGLESVADKVSFIQVFTLKKVPID
jgi:hypothetical protein